MLISNRKSFALGAVLAAGFLAVLTLIFSPVFGTGRNGLEYADDIFNKLSKSSSYFIPKVAKGTEKLAGVQVVADLKFESPQLTERALAVLAVAGAQVSRNGTAVHIEADLGSLLGRCLVDAEDGFRNDSAKLSARYGIGERDVLAGWWKILNQLAKSLAVDNRTAEADAVIAVMKKAIEPAHNYYGIEAGEAKDMAATMSALLVFYVVYTIWWGSAIYYLFEGIGLIMRKEAVVLTPSGDPVRQS